jgi:tetratricopeptide (TPR) repeat protein
MANERPLMSRRKDRNTKAGVAAADDRPRRPSDAAVRLPPAQTPVRAPSPYAAAAVCGLLLLAVALIFGNTVSYDFVSYDDGLLVCENPVVARGITAQGVAWAFTTSVANMWYPLTWISYMADSQIYGPMPWGYHCTNVLLHAATSVLLFLLLWRMTGNLWAGALAALLFAIHPLRAEAVAWVGERKSPLSGLFFVSTIAAYVAYARRPFSLARYLAVAVLFTLGLLAKPTLVTLPLVLLLLDYWPLGRISHRRRSGAGKSSSDGALREPAHNRDEGFHGSDSVRNPPVSSGRGQRLSDRPPSPACRRAPCTHGRQDGRGAGGEGGLQSRPAVIAEKIPLLLLSVACSVAAVLSQAGNIAPLESVPIPARIANALISYAVYLGQFFWPVGLAAFYPRSETLPAWQVGGAFLVLVLVSAAALLSWRSQPAVLVGWLWYLGMLAPMIGLVQIGAHARADRYTYLPQMGLCIAVVWGARWGVDRLCGDGPSRRWLYAVGGALPATVFMACGWQQTAVWRNSETLWTHTLACTSRNPIAHNNLGNALAARGQVDEAIAHYRMALEIKPDDVKAHNNLGSALAGRGQIDEAIAHYHKALQINPDDAETHNNLALVLAARGQTDEAIAHYRRALELKPVFAEAHYNLGLALAARGRVDEAIAHYQKALKIKPDYVKAHNNLATALAGRGQVDEAIDHYRKALVIKPDDVKVHINLGDVLAGRGKLDEALAHYQTALGLASARNDSALADVIRARIKLCQSEVIRKAQD